MALPSWLANQYHAIPENVKIVVASIMQPSPYMQYAIEQQVFD